jgi:hippurate hydrolase
VVSVGTFQAGIASNVIPESAVMELSVRAMKPEIRDLLIKRIHELAEFTAKSYGASSEIEVYDSYPVLTNSVKRPISPGRWRWRCLAAKGCWIGLADERQRGFRLYAAARPGCYFLLGNGEKGEKGGCMVHNPGYDFNDDIITTGATLFARLVETHCR